MKRDFCKYILALVLFGSNGVVASRIALSSYEIVLLCTGIGSALLMALFLLRGGKFHFWQHKREFAFLTASGIAMGVSWMFLYEAYQRIGVSLSSLLYYCGPVIVMALSPLLFREKLTAAKIVSFLVVAMGVVAVNGGVEGGIQDHWGLFCGAMSALMYAAMVICSKKTVHITGMENSFGELSHGGGVYGAPAGAFPCRSGGELAVDFTAGPDEHGLWLLLLLFLHREPAGADRCYLRVSGASFGGGFFRGAAPRDHDASAGPGGRGSGGWRDPWHPVAAEKRIKEYPRQACRGYSFKVPVQSAPRR